MVLQIGMTKLLDKLSVIDRQLLFAFREYQKINYLIVGQASLPAC